MVVCFCLSNRHFLHSIQLSGKKTMDRKCAHALLQAIVYTEKRHYLIRDRNHECPRAPALTRYTTKRTNKYQNVFYAFNGKQMMARISRNRRHSLRQQQKKKTKKKKLRTIATVCDVLRPCIDVCIAVTIFRKPFGFVCAEIVRYERILSSARKTTVTTILLLHADGHCQTIRNRKAETENDWRALGIFTKSTRSL